VHSHVESFEQFNIKEPSPGPSEGTETLKNGLSIIEEESFNPPPSYTSGKSSLLYTWMIFLSLYLPEPIMIFCSYNTS
jgi:hypothetical protein